MARVGFNVGDFITPFRGDILSGVQGGLDASMTAMRAGTSWNEALLRDAMAGKELAATTQTARAQLAARELARQAINARALEASQRAGARLEMDQRKMLRDEGRYQQDHDATALKNVLGPFAAGDLNALSAAAAQAKAQDPTLDVFLPEQVGGGQRVDPSIPSVEEAYGSPDLRIERGGRPLYAGNPEEVRANEAAIPDAALGPLTLGPFGGAFSLGKQSAAGLAGRGMTGKDALEFGAAVGKEGANRQAAAQRAATMAGQREEGQDLQLRKFKQSSVRQVTQDVANNDMYKKQVEALNLAEQGRKLLSSGSSLGEKIAAVKMMRSIQSGVLTNQDQNFFLGATGKLTQLEQTLNDWGGRGELPAEFKAQMEQIGTQLEGAVRARIMEMGKKARDQVYSLPSVPFSSIEDMVDHADQAQAPITGRHMTPEEKAAEVKRVRGLLLGQPGSAPLSTPPSNSGAWQPTIPPGTPMSPGDTDGPANNRPSAPSNEEMEALEELRRLEELNAGP